MAQMDDIHTPLIQAHGSGSPGVDFPQSQELFSDQEHAEPDIEGDVGLIPQELDASSQHDNSQLFQDQIVCAPSRTRRTRGCKKLNSVPVQNSDESSDYEPPPRKLTLKEVFDNHFRKKKWKNRKKKKRKRHVSTEKTQPPKVCKTRKPVYSTYLLQRKRRLLHYGIRFPFVSKKHLSLRQCFAYEQYVLGGFLNYIKNHKYVSHLQRSLKNMEAGEELEEGSLEMRKYRYLDDEEPLSPISESGESNEVETETCDAKVVENSSFILDCRIPSKEQWKIKVKRSKANN